MVAFGLSDTENVIEEVIGEGDGVLNRRRLQATTKE